MKLELKKIRQQRENWLKAVNKNDIDAMKDLLTKDAVWIPPGLPALNGKKAIVDWMKPFFDTYSYEFTITDMHIKGAGDWAVEQSEFSSKLVAKDDSGETSTNKGRYIMIWRWEKDNQWRIERYLDDSEDDDI
jgi:uncharacterized protein (TIGR02246 family)